FGHELGHATQALAGTFQQAERQQALRLTAQDTSQPLVTEQQLASALKQAKETILLKFNNQNKARQSLAADRLDLLKKLKSPQEASTSTSPLQSFKVEESALPLVNAAGTEEGCCGNEGKPAKAGKQESHGCDHDEGGGIVIDLDEAAHGAFASTKYLKEVAQGRPEAVADSFKNSAAEMASNPIHYLGKELTESGVAEFSTAVGAGAFMLPLAALAVKAGIEEWQHGSHELKELKAVRNEQTSALEDLKGAAQALSSDVLNSRIQAQELRLEKTAEAMKQAQKDREIGAMSAASGLTIGLKALTDLGLKISVGIKGAFTGKGFFALGETAQAGTAAASTAVGLGIAGTFVLGPLAGVFATALGALFTVKTVTKLKQLKTDFQLLKSDLKTDTLARQEQVQKATAPLEAFLVRQGEKRIGFFKGFARWNKAFMVGSGLYAASAATKAVVVGVAAAGLAAAVSNPIGLGVITAVGIVGAIAMGITSFSFLRGHGKQGKYSRATAADHAWVDRKLMTDLHSMQAITKTTPAGETEEASASHPGFDMAGNCLKYLDTQKNELRDFLGKVATSAKKHSPMEKNLSWWKYIGRKVINDKAVRKFLGTETGKLQFRDFVQTSLTAKVEMLAERLQHRKLLMSGFEAANPAAETEGLSAGEKLKHAEEMSKTFKRMDLEYSHDQAELELNLLRLKKLEAEPMPDFDFIASCMDAGSTVKETGKFLYKEMDREIRHARGVLFESQLEGARLREKQYLALKKT
ncbi:MAG TPA: hypothetical protein VFV28_08610, partial [Limnobacter sp.]|nr:hypothetical protein [Limnobacter sp.]